MELFASALSSAFDLDPQAVRQTSDLVIDRFDGVTTGLATPSTITQVTPEPVLACTCCSR